MSAIYRLTQAHSEAINRLVSASFGYGARLSSPHTFFDDFPIWNSPSVTRLGIFEGDQLVAHVGLRYAEMLSQKANETLSEKFALIGAVATDSKARGKGYSSQLLQEALLLSEKEACAWTVLWGSEHAFYQRFGFTLVGAQARACIGDLSIPTQDLRSTPIKTGFHKNIFKAICAQKNGIKINEEDLNWMQAHKTVKWFYLDEPFAYVAFERGMDLPHTVHELGGNLNGIQKLLFHIHSLDPEAQIIARPDTLSLLGFLGQQMIEEFLCLAKPRMAGEAWNPGYWISGLGAC